MAKQILTTEQKARHAGVPKTMPLAERLAYYSRRDPRTGCLLWTGAKDEDGYGILQWQGNARRAHRLAWTVANGPIPAGKQVQHRCDNSSCVEFGHLRLGTNTDNVADKVARRRHGWGERNGRAKLTAEQVIAVRADRRTCKEIAAQYGVTGVQVSQIKRGKAWKHVGGPLDVRGQLRGERSGNAKLTDRQVAAILVDRRLQREIAAEYGVSQASISLIKSGTHWRHVPIEGVTQ